eukprot:1476732-Prymnesium_polylepis.1
MRTRTRWRAASCRPGAGRRVGPRRVMAWMTWACERGPQWRGMAGRRVTWRGMAWRGVAWRGVIARRQWRDGTAAAWRGVAWRGVVWRG